MQLSPESVKNNLFLSSLMWQLPYGFSQLRKQPFPVNEKSLLRIQSSPFYPWKSLLQNMKCSSTLISAQTPHLSPRLSNNVQNYLPKPFRSFSVILQILLILGKTLKGYRLLAVDGSDICIPRDPEDPETYRISDPYDKGYNLLHLNALYDLLSRTYIDAILQPCNSSN